MWSNLELVILFVIINLAWSYSLLHHQVFLHTLNKLERDAWA